MPPTAPANDRSASCRYRSPNAGGEVALKVTGDVANEQAWAEDEVKAMNAIDVESTNSKGETATYTGVLLSELIAAAKPNADANMVVFVADDGFTAEIGLDKLMACADCIASFRSNGGFSTVLPDYPRASYRLREWSRYKWLLVRWRLPNRLPIPL